MKHYMTKLWLLTCVTGMLTLTACSGTPASAMNNSAVENALNSNLVAVPPYTRTIFSSNNF